MPALPNGSSIQSHGGRPLRIGAVNYLNTKPLVYGLEKLLPEAQLVYDLPSRLADSLAADELDIALVPSIELNRHPEWKIVSDACIACRGPVLSVKLMFRTDPAQVCSLALDEGSRTSAVLAQILLKEIYDIRPKLEILPIGSDPEAACTDGVLVIGDRAMRSTSQSFVEVWDLGDRWCRWAELPFVFAMWVARAGIDTDSVAEQLAKARDDGCQHLAEIAQVEAESMGLSRDVVQNYLSQNLHYQLHSKERSSLDYFFKQVARLEGASALQPANPDSERVL
ncbi:MAG: menaquinone biosynthesis protein [Pirellulales bacterium]